LRITASTVLSYVNCPREAWFIHHNIIPDQSNPFLELGRYIHERSYQDLGERIVELPGMKMDIVWKEKNFIVIGEIKKSSKSIIGARMQLLYYLYEMNELGFNVRGFILIPKERKRIEIVLNEKNIRELKNLLDKAEKVVSLDIPPEIKKHSKCSKCAYSELCWA